MIIPKIRETKCSIKVDDGMQPYPNVVKHAITTILLHMDDVRIKEVN